MPGQHTDLDRHSLWLFYFPWGHLMPRLTRPKNRLKGSDLYQPNSRDGPVCQDSNAFVQSPFPLSSHFMSAGYWIDFPEREQIQKAA